MKFRAYNIVEIENATEENVASPESVALNEGFATGYDTEGADRGNIKMDYDIARQKAAEMFGEETLNKIDDDPLFVAKEMRFSKFWDSEQEGVLVNYINLKSQMDGIFSHVRDMITDRVRKANKEIDSHVNKDDGMIHKAKLGGDKRDVYITTGNLVLNEDGTVNIQESDDTITWVASDGSDGMAPPENFSDVQQPINTDELRKETSENIRYEIAQREANQIDGMLELKPGMSVTLLGDEGSYDVQIKSLYDDKARIVYNGQLYEMPVSEIQSAAYNARLAEHMNARDAESNEEQSGSSESQEHVTIEPGTFHDVVLNDNGNLVEGRVAQKGDGTYYFITTDEVSDDAKFQNLTDEQLYEIMVEHNGRKVSNGYYQDVQEEPSADVEGEQEMQSEDTNQQTPENESNDAAQQEQSAEQEVEEEQPKTALEQIPFTTSVDKKGNVTRSYQFEKVEPSLTYDAFFDKFKGAEGASRKIDNRIRHLQSQIETTQKKIDKLDESDDFDADFSDNSTYDALHDELDQMKNSLAFWQRVKLVPAERQAQESNAIRDEEQKTAEEKAKEAAEQAEKERVERERVNGVPDILNDKPADARARGFRSVSGRPVSRQDSVQFVKGRDASVKFSNSTTQHGSIAVIEADQLQPSHVNGQRNAKFFIDEAQPKDRTDAVSSSQAEKIAFNLNPAEITGDGSAYQFSAPSVNVRGEVIQGNNRSEALKLMYSSDQYRESQETYKQYLMDHSEEFGLDRDAISQMNNPVMVNVLPVTDEEAIRLGQQTASDIESGGIERMDPVTTSRKIGDRMGSYAQILLQSDEDMSLSDAVVNNGSKVMQWLHNNKFISDTQYKSAFKNGELTAEAKMDLVNLLKQSLFEGGVTELPKMFDMLPAKAQKAILSTFMRDFNSNEADRILPEIQQAIEAFYEASAYSEGFASAKNYEEARYGMEAFLNQYINVNGESILPSDKFSQFAMELACRMKGLTMREQAATFNQFFDLVQGTYQPGLFEGEAGTEAMGMIDAARKAFNITINQKENGKESGTSVDEHSSNGEVEGTSSNERTEGRESDKEGERTSDSTTGTESNDSSLKYREAVKAAEEQTDQNPSEAQKKAGNYAKGKVTIDGLHIAIENPKGSIRSGKDGNQKPWSVKMNNTYGYILGTEGKDGDHLDIFLSDNPSQGDVYVVDQVKEDGSFDEHKVMYGFKSAEEAKKAYMANYSPGWKGFGTITRVTRSDFKKWLNSSHKKTKPFSEYTKFNNSRAGLVMDEFSTSLPEADMIDKIAELLGLTVRFTDETGPGDAYILGNNVYIRKGKWSGNKTLKFLVGHEFTHRMQDVSPEQYAKFKQFAKDFMGEEWQKEHDKTRRLYDRHNAKAKLNGEKVINISDQQIDDEVTADFAGHLVDDMDVFNNFIQKLNAEKEGKSLMQIIRDLFEKVKNYFKPQEQKRIENAIAQLESLIRQSATTMAEKSEQAPLDVSYFDPSTNEARFSLSTYEEKGRMYLKDYLARRVKSRSLSKADAQQILDKMDELYEICNQYRNKYVPFSKWSDAKVVKDKNGNPVFSVIKPNGEYAMNLDFSLVCKKRRTLDAVFNEMIKRNIIDDIILGQVEVAKINDIIRRYGFETACRLCFVDARRFRVASVADEFCEVYNKLVKKLIPKGKDIKVNYFDFGGEGSEHFENGLETIPSKELNVAALKRIKSKEDSKRSVVSKCVDHLLNHPEDRKLLRRSDFVSTQGFNSVKEKNEKILSLYNAKKGSGGPKASFGDVQYLNDVAKKRWGIKKAYDVGGVRIQSFSDYVPRMVFDYIQMVSELAAKKLPAHAYTKEKMFVMQFGKTGIKINMSLVPGVVEGGIAPGLDENGNYVWQQGETFNYDDAVAIQNTEGYRENCGTIAVGVSDEHIRKMMDDPNIRMIIPYHKSGLNQEVAIYNKINSFQDYTNYQNTRYADGTALKKGDFDAEHPKIAEPDYNAWVVKSRDPRKAAQKYIDWCKKNNLMPKFSQFAFNEDGTMNENYYKVLEDFTTLVPDENGNMVYYPQTGVRMEFPTEDDAFGSMSELIGQGLEEDA